MVERERQWRLGFHPVREALRRSPQSAERVLISARKGRRRTEIEGLCTRHGVPVESVARSDLEQWNLEVHNGFALKVKSAEQHSPPSGDPKLIVLLEDIQDPRNLGAILRVCEGAGVGKVMIRDRGSAPFSETVGKTSAGALEWIEVERITNSSTTIDNLQREGFWVYGAAMTGDPPWEVDLKGPIVIALGGEANGLRRKTQGKCDGLIGLPMKGQIESLNVATAASAILYEALRQRGDSV